MNAMNFDTLAAAERIQAAGVQRDEAVAIVKEIVASQAELFSKADGVALESGLKTAIGDVKNDTLKWMFGMMLVIVGAGNTLVLFAINTMLKH